MRLSAHIPLLNQPAGVEDWRSTRQDFVVLKGGADHSRIANCLFTKGRLRIIVNNGGRVGESLICFSGERVVFRMSKQWFMRVFHSMEAAHLIFPLNGKKLIDFSIQWKFLGANFHSMETVYMSKFCGVTSFRAA